MKALARAIFYVVSFCFLAVSQWATEGFFHYKSWLFWSPSKGPESILSSPMLYLWLALNAAVVSTLLPWWRKGIIPRRPLFTLFLTLSVWVSGGWLYGWWTHLNHPPVWYSHDTRMLQYFIAEGLQIPTQTLNATAVCFSALSVWGMLVWVRHSSRNIQQLGVGLLLMAGLATILLAFTEAKTFAWATLCWALNLLTLGFLWTGKLRSETIRSPQTLKPGWKELDDDTQLIQPKPTPLPTLLASCGAICCACWATYNHIIFQYTHTVQLPSHSIPETLAHLPRSYQSYSTELTQLWYFFVYSLSSLALLGLVFLLLQSSTLERYRYRYQKQFLVAMGSLALVALFAFGYQQKSRDLVFENAPSYLHGVAHSLRAYPKVSKNPAFLSRWTYGTVSTQPRLSDLAFFPLPLVVLGERRSIIHVSMRQWTVQHGRHVHRTLLNGKGMPKTKTSLHLRCSKKFPREGILIVHPLTPVQTFRAVRKEIQRTHKVVYLLLATPNRWQSGEAHIPYLSHLWLSPLRNPVAKRKAEAPIHPWITDKFLREQTKRSPR